MKFSKAYDFESVQRRGLISPDKMSGRGKLSTMSSKQMSSKKFDIHWIFYSKMSGQNSKCPVKDCRFAGYSVQLGSNKFQVQIWKAKMIVWICTTNCSKVQIEAQKQHKSPNFTLGVHTNSLQNFCAHMYMGQVDVHVFLWPHICVYESAP